MALLPRQARHDAAPLRVLCTRHARLAKCAYSTSDCFFAYSAALRLRRHTDLNILCVLDAFGFLLLLSCAPALYGLATFTLHSIIAGLSL